MKTIQLEVQDAIYQRIIDFLALLPPEQCYLINNDDFNNEERLENQELNTLADERLNDGQALIRMSLDEL